MALYLGSGKKQKIQMQDKKCKLSLYFNGRVPNGALRSLDEFLLKDMEGLYLIAKEEK